MAKRVRPARHYQRRDAPVRQLADRSIALVARDLRQAFDHLSELVPVEQATKLGKEGRWPEIAGIIHWNHYREILKAPFARLVKVRTAGAELGVQQINAAFAAAHRKVRFAKDVGDRFNFDMLDEATQERVRQAQDELIAELEQTARDTIDATVTAGIQAGLSAEEIVGDIREVIGLTATQASAVSNYQTMLEGLDPDALRRQLRNKTQDQAVLDALDSGITLDTDVIEAMVADYESNYLDYRAATIAQTESTRAANGGLQDAYQQAIDRGALPEDAVRVFWKVALDERTCEVCLSIPDQNDEGQPVGEPFDSIEGPVDAPPDPHPRCRCSLEFVTDLSLVPDTEDAFA